MKAEYITFSYIAIAMSWLAAMMIYDFKHTETQNVLYELSLAKKEIKTLNEELNTPKRSCSDLELDLIAQKKLNHTLQENILHLEKLEYICETEELDYQSLTFRVQELEEDCKCR